MTEKVINECIQKGILESFLKKNKAEVLRMSIFEYDQENISSRNGMRQGKKAGKRNESKRLKI